jgi:hypothetical protein
MENKKLKENNSMQAGAIEGAAGVATPTPVKRRKHSTKREKFLEELQLRGLIRTMIAESASRRQNTSLKEEQELRNLIKHLIREAKKDTEDLPHNSTAINVLESLLKGILPGLEIDYKSLTTAEQQRISFRAHIINAVATILETEEINAVGGGELVGLDEQDEDDNIQINIDDENLTDDEKFIDIEDKKVEDAEAEHDKFGLPGEDETGRNLAQPAFKRIEKNIVETYGILSDEKDKTLFTDYLITNLKLYFDKWESELGAVQEPTTDEYEAEVGTAEAEASAGAGEALVQ